MTSKLAALALLVLAGACTRTAIDANAPAVRSRAERAGDVRFIAVGDTGMGNRDQRAVAAQMARACAARGCDFVLLLGDNLYRSGAASADDAQWKEKFEAPYALLDMPFFAALGNHDYGGDGAGDDFGRPDNEIAYSARSKKWRMPARRYHFEEGLADFFALDTNLAAYGQDGAQADEVNGWIARSKATWKIAFGHHPYLSNGKHGNAGSYDGYAASDDVRRSGARVKALLEKSVCGKADVYLAGHDHSLQWLEPTCAGTELVVSGGGAEATGVQPRNPARFARGGLGFLYVRADATALAADFIGDDGQVAFSRTLQKKAP